MASGEPEPGTAPPAADDPVDLSGDETPMVRRMVAHLRSAIGLDDPVDVRRFPGGRANLTYAVTAGERELVVRRPPFGPLPPRAHDMPREHRVLSALSERLPFVPRPVYLCTDPAVIGVPFFVMERVHGFVLRDRWPGFLPEDPGLRGRIAGSFLATVVDLHRLDAAEVGLDSLGRPEGFMDRQVRGWTGRWHDSALDADPNADAVLAWLSERHFPPQSAAIVHNDLKLDNVMLRGDDPGRVRAVFDWDMCTLGDPLADLGLILTYWGEPADDPAVYAGRLPITALPGFPGRDWLVEEYARRTERDVSAIGSYHVFGLVKLAVLCQQLLRRYLDGGSHDARLAEYETQVPAIWAEARRLVETPR